jgi:hypothetical protein
MEMISRLEVVLKANALSQNTSKYSHAIILGGSNDLPWLNGEKIFSNLKTLFELVESYSIVLVCVTIPDSHYVRHSYYYSIMFLNVTRTERRLRKVELEQTT